MTGKESKTRQHSGQLQAAICISGRGSNMKALIESCKDPDFPVRIICVIADRADAKGLEYARAENIPAHIVSYESYNSKSKAEQELSKVLKQYDPDILCLAGFMRVLSPDFLAQIKRMTVLNIHPSLLPEYKGLHVHERVIKAGETVSGCTVHYVSEDLDSGEIILQCEVPVRSQDTPASLAERVLEKEHEAYPEALRIIAEKYVVI